MANFKVAKSSGKSPAKSTKRGSKKSLVARNSSRNDNQKNLSLEHQHTYLPPVAVVASTQHIRSTRTTLPSISDEQKVHCRRVMISENDPGVLICWDHDLVQAAVNAINNNAIVHQMPRPAFVGSEDPMTVGYEAQNYIWQLLSGLI